MELVANPWFYAVAIPAVLIIGISKAGIGGVAGNRGVGRRLTPTLALTMVYRIGCNFGAFGLVSGCFGGVARGVSNE